MALQNIGTENCNDPFYRYKMPMLITRIEGCGNSSKTKVVNVVAVAKALARPPAYIMQFFGCNIGLGSSFDEKTRIGIVQGSHDTTKLATLLENFIKKYVQCNGCKNPETEMAVTPTKLITLECAACGYLSAVDMSDKKMTNFILNNPAEQKMGVKYIRLWRAEKHLKEAEAASKQMEKLKRKAMIKKSKSGDDNVVKKQGSDGEGQSPSVSPTDDEETGDEEDDESSEDEDDESSEDEDDESSEDEEHDEGSENEDNVQWQTNTSAEAALRRSIELMPTRWFG